MKTKRFISILTTITMVLGLFSGITVTAETTEPTNHYDAMLEEVKPENNYGLPDEMDGGNVLVAWNWSFENIENNLEKIAEQGFGTVLVSPPNEIKMPTKDVKVLEPEVDGISPNGWWMFYEPAGFQINESEDNALGTKDDFVSMCDAAATHGIKIMVDTVVGYMGSDYDHVGVYDNTSIDPLEHVNSRAQEFELELLNLGVFHNPWNMFRGKELYQDGWSDYDIEEDLTQHAVSGRPDLATETQVVQDAIYDYLVELVEAGADGFWFTDAKHIETKHDEYFPSDFWDDTIGKLRENYPDKELYAVGGISGSVGDGRNRAEYTEYMDVPDTNAFLNIYHAVDGGTVNPVPVLGDDETYYQENFVLFTEDAEYYKNAATSSATAEQRNKIWALVAARKNVTGTYFVRPDDTAAENKEEVAELLAEYTLGDAFETTWASDEVRAINQFANYFADEDENCYVQYDIAVIQRGTQGAVLTNLGGMGGAIGLDTQEISLDEGKYIDAITGNEFTVENGELSGGMGDSGIAVLYYAGEIDENVYLMAVKDSSESEPLISEPILMKDADGDGIYTGSCFLTPDTEGWIRFYRCDSAGNQLGVGQSGYFSVGRYGVRFEYNIETGVIDFYTAFEDNDILLADISVSGTYTYTGEEIEPPVEVTYFGEILEEGTDYTLEYSDNMNAGVATVTVSGIGDYCGVGTAFFEIGKVPVENKAVDKSFHYARKTMVIDLREYYPDVDFENAEYHPERAGEGITPYAEDANLIIKIDDDYTREDVTGQPFNCAKVNVSIPNYEDFCIAFNLYFAEKADISDKMVCEAQDVTYSGQDNLPTASLADDVVPGDNGEWSYIFSCDGFETTSAVDAGHYVGTVIYEDDTYYGEKDVEFDVLKAVPEQASLTVATVNNGDILENAILQEGVFLGVDGEPLEGTFEWADGDKVITEDSVETIRFIPANSNYSEIEFDVEVRCVDFENAIVVGNIPLVDGDYLTNGGEIRETKPSSGGYAYYKNGVLTLNDYEYEGNPDENIIFESYTPDEEGDDYVLSATVYSPHDLEIKLVGENRLTNCNSYEGTGIYCEGNLTMGGKGSVEIDTVEGEDGIWVLGDLTVKGGTVKIHAYDDGITADGDVNITGGTIDIKTDDDDGIEAKGSINISGGTILMETADNGIIASPLFTGFGELIRNNGDITISGGTINIKSGDECIKANVSYGADDEEYGGGNIIISGGEIIADSETADALEADRRMDEKETGNIRITGGKLHFEIGYSGIEADGEIEIDNADIYILSREKSEEDMGIVAVDGITLGKGIEITSPAGGKIGKNSDDEYTVVKRNGEVADEIEISKVSTSGNKGGGSSGSSSNSYTVGGAPIKPIPRPGILPTAKTFDDVHSIKHWAKADVDYVLEKGLMKGVSENMFDPDGNVTRAMLVTVLYRNEGEPAVNRSIPFGDIDMGAYYANAVSWAKQNGIVVGITENEFAPDESITREQIAAIMYRYAIYKGMEAVTLEENLHFEDSDKISEYAVSAMNWAVGSGLMKGKSESAFKPQDLATRAECAVILHRFVETNK